MNGQTAADRETTFDRQTTFNRETTFERQAQHTQLSTALDNFGETGQLWRGSLPLFSGGLEPFDRDAWSRFLLWPPIRPHVRLPRQRLGYQNLRERTNSWTKPAGHTVVPVWTHPFLACHTRSVLNKHSRPSWTHPPRIRHTVASFFTVT